MDNKQCALHELHSWITEAESFFASAAGRDYHRHPHIALSYLQLSAEFAFKAVIVSLTGNNLRTRNPYVLCIRCRRLLPLLGRALILSQRKQPLFHFLLPAFGLQRGEGTPLPDGGQWKELLQHVRQLLQLALQLCRERIETLF
ncbi:MAG TPA: HEPN domain-containing protein [Chitinophagaceae bacterium]